MRKAGGLTEKGPVSLDSYQGLDKTSQVQKLSSQQPGLSQFSVQKSKPGDSVGMCPLAKMQSWLLRFKGIQPTHTHWKNKERTEQAFQGQLFPVAPTAGGSGGGGRGPGRV